jgi:hypothetical protein
MGMGSSSRKEEDAAQMVLICLELIEGVSRSWDSGKRALLS